MAVGHSAVTEKLMLPHERSGESPIRQTMDTVIMTSEPVIQLESLLAPIPGDNPAGQDLLRTVVRDLQNLRRESDSFGEAKPVQWSSIINMANSALVEKTKDVRIGFYLAEAVVKEHGFVGLRDGLRLIRGLVEGFWEHVYPVGRDGSFKARASALQLLNDKLDVAVRQVPLTRTMSGERYSYLQWQDSEQFKIPENVEELESEEKSRIEVLKKRAADEGKITSEQWRSAVRATAPQLFAQTEALLAESQIELAALEQVMDKLFTHVRPGLEELKQAIDTAAAEQTPDRDALRRALTEAQAELEDAAGLADFKEGLDEMLRREKIDPNALKRASARLIENEAPPIGALKNTLDVLCDLIRPLVSAEMPTTTESEKQPDLVEPILALAPTPAPSAREISSRQEALERLADVAAYFRRAESFNPASNLIERAIEWGDLSLEQWLAQVIEDQEKLGSLRERLGIKPGGSNGQPPGEHSILGKIKLAATALMPAVEKKPDISLSNGINNRQQAVARLTEVATYFRKAEPHNPALCLIDRAVAWNEMPLGEWLAQIIEDETVLSRLHKRLEIKPGGQTQ